MNSYPHSGGGRRPRKSKVEMSREKLELAKNNFLEQKYKKLSVPQAKYDVVDVNNSRKRRTMSPETQEEHEILRPYDRMKAINLGRDLERNFTAAKSILRQLKINVVGNLGKMKLNTGDMELDASVSNWFNGVYARNCDARADLHFCEILQLVLSSVIREGDILVAFDSFNEDDGRLMFWESDQLVGIDSATWKTNKKYPDGKYSQTNGVIYDRYGRVAAYAVTSKRGVESLPFDEVLILPVSVAKLVKNPFRFNQIRGVSDVLAASADMEDLYEMRAKELQSAKVASSYAGVVKSESNNQLEDAILRGGIAPETLVDTVGASEQTSEKPNYDNLEALTGGYMEYLQPGEEFQLLNPNRPQVAFKDFFEFVTTGAGAGFGLSKSYTTLTPAGSYTAFRGDMLIAWQTFYGWQKFLERHFCDWVAEKAISHAIRKKSLPVRLPQDWAYRISWIWPVMPQIDPVAETNAIKEKLRLGITTYSEILGPDWEKKIEKLSSEIGLIKDKYKLDHLSIFETTAGARVDNQTSTKETEKNEET